MSAVFPFEPAAHPDVRRAALTLYAAREEDRAWMLSQLPTSDLPCIKQMLSELADLGIPRDPEMVRSALRDGTRGAARAAAPRDLQVLRVGDAPALAALLEHEPAQLIACLAALLEPACRAALLEVLNAPQRRQVLAALGTTGQAPVGDRLRQALLQELDARLPRRVETLPWWRRVALPWVLNLPAWRRRK